MSNKAASFFDKAKDRIRDNLPMVVRDYPYVTGFIVIMTLIGVFFLSRVL